MPRDTSIELGEARRFNPNKPRWYLVYALAPESIPMGEADRAFDEFINRPELGLVLYHNQFVDRVGGLAIFWLENETQLRALSASNKLSGWSVYVLPLTFSDSGGGFLAQIGFTLRQYRGMRISDLIKVGKSTWAEPVKG